MDFQLMWVPPHHIMCLWEFGLTEPNKFKLFGVVSRSDVTYVA